ncbi:MAG TPA: HAMP domain-containing sensor histidine kinase [Allosphingosinicella sp.]
MIGRLSLHARLLIVAALTGLAALAFAFFAIGHVLEGFVLRALDDKLDTQAAVLARAVEPDGRLDPTRVVELPDFETPGWGWRVRSAAGEWSGGSGVAGHQTPPMQGRGLRGGKGRGRDGRALYVRRLDIETATGPAEIVTAAPRRIIDSPLRAAMMPMLVSLGLLALGLAVATLIQLRYGLRPVRTLRDAVARVRKGDAQVLPVDQPIELRPLAEEVNALIAQNEAGLQHARRHVANLAHGLKTPLATLSLKLARDGSSAEARALVGELDQRIAHHLRRARAGAVASGQRARTNVREVVADLVDAVSRVHAGRQIEFEVSVDSDLVLAVDRQDLDEMLGNLFDNAARHARRCVRITAAVEEAMVRLVVDDDGAGMGEKDVVLAMTPGARLDESGVGYGFGLGIVRELAELYGGALWLLRSKLGGLSAQILLPR